MLWSDWFLDLQVEPMVDLAQWMLVQKGIRPADAEDVLLAAADILLDIETVDEDDE